MKRKMSKTDSNIRISKSTLCRREHPPHTSRQGRCNNIYMNKKHEPHKENKNGIKSMISIIFLFIYFFSPRTKHEWRWDPLPVAKKNLEEWCIMLSKYSKNCPTQYNYLNQLKRQTFQLHSTFTNNKMSTKLAVKATQS